MFRCQCLCVCACVRVCVCGGGCGGVCGCVCVLCVCARHLLACGMCKVLGIRAFIFLQASVLHNLVSIHKETNKTTASR